MIDPMAWDALMERARHESHVNVERRRVVGVRVWDTPGRWTYIVQCESGCRVCRTRAERARVGFRVGRSLERHHPEYEDFTRRHGEGVSPWAGT